VSDPVRRGILAHAGKIRLGPRQRRKQIAWKSVAGSVSVGFSCRRCGGEMCKMSKSPTVEQVV
jgi:hypothetical protein